MTSLPSLLGALSAALQAHPLCKRVTEIETREFAADQFIFKIRAEFTHKTRFQTRIYFNRGHIDYAYQLFADLPLLRWDNKEEFRFIETYRIRLLAFWTSGDYPQVGTDRGNG